MKTLWQTWCYIQLTLISRGLFSVVDDWLVDNEDSPAVLWNRWAKKNWRMTSPDTAKWHRRLPWCWFTPGVEKLLTKWLPSHNAWIYNGKNQILNPKSQNEHESHFEAIGAPRKLCHEFSAILKVTSPPKDSWRLANAFQAGQDSENLVHSNFWFPWVLLF